MDADRRIGRARPAGDEGDAGAAGHLAVRFGHEGGAAFLPADHKVDLGAVVQRIERGEEAFARNGEDPVAALRDQVVDQDTSAGSLGHDRRRIARRSLVEGPPFQHSNERQARLT
jgi:hypothetical protein